MPLIVRSNSGKTSESLLPPKQRVETSRDLFGDQPAASSRRASCVQIAIRDTLVRPDDVPLRTMDHGRIKFYQIRKGDGSTYYAITVHDQQIGPFDLIKRAKSDRYRTYVELSPTTVIIPASLEGRVFYLRMVHVHDANIPEQFAFVADGAKLEVIQRIMRRKYPDPGASELPNVVLSDAATYLAIEERGR